MACVFSSALASALALFHVVHEFTLFIGLQLTMLANPTRIRSFILVTTIVTLGYNILVNLKLKKKKLNDFKNKIFIHTI